MHLTELVMIMILAVFIWFWLESMKINEIARMIGARKCRENNVQFLDDTVQLSSIKIGKNSYGQLKLIRHYNFEFTNSELHRYKGKLSLAGKQLIEFYMDAYRLNEINYNEPE